MEEANLEKIHSMIKGIEKKNTEFQQYLSNVKILSRNNILKEISYDIIKNNKLFQKLQVGSNGVYVTKQEIKKTSNYNFIEEIISKIQNNPTKKIIFLREFLNKIEGISENDKDVILQSLSNEKIETEELKEKIITLANIFKLNI